jgi:hypothetical protein
VLRNFQSGSSVAKSSSVVVELLTVAGVPPEDFLLQRWGGPFCAPSVAIHLGNSYL